MASLIRIGSRPSRLALAQAELVRHKLGALAPEAVFEIVPIRTSGDRMTTAALAEVGGKGLFVKELEQALAEGQVDIAVHSMKDMPARIAPGFRIAAVPERADPRDALLSRIGGSFAALPRGARLGTSSARRRFEAQRLRPDLEIVPLRGNIDTRLARASSGDFDAIILAMAGLMRIGPTPDEAVALALTPLDVPDFVPCGGQGALCVEALADRPVAGSAELDALVAVLDDPGAHLEVTAERAFLAALGASCVSPIGVLARLDSVTLVVRALVFSLDGTRYLIDEVSDKVADAAPGAPLENAAFIGGYLAERMMTRGARALIALDETAPRSSRGSDDLPLRGRTVVVTRSRESAGGFVAGLRGLGANVIEFPTIKLAPPDSYAEIDAALARRASFDWVIFTSAAGVECGIERMRARGIDPADLAASKLAAIGPATAAHLAAHGLEAAAMPGEYRAEAIIDAIGAERIRDARILIPRAQVAREVLPERLHASGAREVVVAPVYKTVRPADAPVEKMREMALAGKIDLVAFTSSSTVTNFCEMLGDSAARAVKAAAIGPITAEAARSAAIEVVAEPREYTVPALISAIRDYFISLEK